MINKGVIYFPEDLRPYSKNENTDRKTDDIQEAVMTNLNKSVPKKFFLKTPCKTFWSKYLENQPRII